MEENLKKKTTKALVWEFGRQVGTTAVLSGGPVSSWRGSFRLPTTERWGVLTIFIALSGILIDSGFSSALIRKKEATQADYSTVFYLNIAISCLLYG